MPRITGGKQVRGLDGRFQKGQSGNPRGRPKGAKDKGPRAGSIRKVYQDFYDARNPETGTTGYQDMLKAVKEGVRNPKRALGYLELGAKVLDRVDQQTGQAGPRVTIVFQSSINLEKLRSPEVLARARLTHPPTALPARK